MIHIPDFPREYDDCDKCPASFAVCLKQGACQLRTIPDETATDEQKWDYLQENASEVAHMFNVVRGLLQEAKAENRALKQKLDNVQTSTEKLEGLILPNILKKQAE